GFGPAVLGEIVGGAGSRPSCRGCEVRVVAAQADQVLRVAPRRLRRGRRRRNHQSSWPQGPGGRGDTEPLELRLWRRAFGAAGDPPAERTEPHRRGLAATAWRRRGGRIPRPLVRVPRFLPTEIGP